jgi:hypothetical protein
MRPSAQTRLRRFAPAVLALSLFFLATSDAAANCLAAWLCTPRTIADCQRSEAPGLSAAPMLCAFEGRVERGFPKQEPARLITAELVRHQPLAVEPSVELQASLRLGAASRPPDPSPPPLYLLQASLLI